ncbi:MAG: hypothetical protein IJX92_05180 [Clostridia bacterium]|nr:hypothetical protein [Clostridia bacterium]
MFNNTRDTISKIARDIRGIYFLFSIITQSFLLVCPIYLLLAGRGNTLANIILLLISAATLVAHVIYERSDKDKKVKKTYKKVKKINRRIRFVIKTVNLISAVYAVCVTFNDPDVFAVLITLGMIIMWVLDLLLLLVSLAFDYLKHKLESAFTEDVNELKDTAKAPIRAAKSIMKRFKKDESTYETEDYILK